MLGLDPNVQEFQLVLGAVSTSDREIAILTRSMLEIMAEASAGIEIPETDLREGRATKQAPLVDTMMVIQVHSADKKPPANNAFTTIKYHEHWFWVDDRDLSSKRGLSFLLGLFTLAESGPVLPPPSLTISKP